MWIGVRPCTTINRCSQLVYKKVLIPNLCSATFKVGLFVRSITVLYHHLTQELKYGFYMKMWLTNPGLDLFKAVNGWGAHLHLHSLDVYWDRDVKSHLSHWSTPQTPGGNLPRLTAQKASSLKTLFAPPCLYICCFHKCKKKKKKNQHVLKNKKLQDMKLSQGAKLEPLETLVLGAANAKKKPPLYYQKQLHLQIFIFHPGLQCSLVSLIIYETL